MAVSSWKHLGDRPIRPDGDNRAAQVAADRDNYRTALARLCKSLPMTVPGDHNYEHVVKLYREQRLPRSRSRRIRRRVQDYDLPGDICDTIRRSPRAKGADHLGGKLDIFRDLVCMDNAAVNKDVHCLCNLVFKNIIPDEVKCYFRDGYLFLAYKDPEDLTKMRLICIPLALRRHVATHVANHWQPRFAAKLLPINYAIYIDGRMDFVIKLMKLTVERYIQEPQSKPEPTLPTRAAVFIDLVNMFNNTTSLMPY